MFMRSSAVVFVVVLGVCPPLWSAEYVKIGSWNIENLGKRNFGQNPKALAEHLQLADVDVLALQEIHDTDGVNATRTNKKLDETFKLINANDGHDWKYILFKNKTPNDKSQLCGVAWNAKTVAKTGEVLRLTIADDPSDDFNVWDRHPHAVKFSTKSGKSDFVVVSLHMKSNVDGVMKGKKQRKLEAELLVGQLGKIKQTFKEDDIIFIGDTNCLTKDEDAAKVFVNKGFKDLNAGGQDSFSHSKVQPFDRVFVPKNQSEFQFSRQYVVTPSDAKKHDKMLSDHFLVMIVMKILDDDDGAN